MGYGGYPPEPPAPPSPRDVVFASEDALAQFCGGLTDKEAHALYAVLYGCGVRYDARALAKWRKR